MIKSEQEFIDLLKKQIEQKYSFGNGHGYSQRDLEIVGGLISEKTATLISLSTLKRFWKGSYSQRPQLATLDALAQLLDYKHWQDFKSVNRDHMPDITATKRSWLVTASIFFALTATVFVFAFQRSNNGSKHPVKISGPVAFTAEKTVSVGIPNTVIFKYDLSNVTADSFLYTTIVE